MASELVLVPKTKYEHLLMLSEKNKSNEQSGGQLETKNETSSIPDNTMVENALNERESTNDTRDVNETQTENIEKPRLYVDKPLSKMNFSTRKLIARKEKKVKTNVNERKFTRTNGRNKNVKTKWINYTI